MGSRRGFGAIRKLPSGRYQASYQGPDLQRHTAPTTFTGKGDAEAWLVARRAEIIGEEWRPPTKAAPVTFAEYAEEWLAERELKPKTRHEYGRLLELRLLPTFGRTPLRLISQEQVKAWHKAQGTKAPTSRARAYGLLRTLLGEATLGDRPLIRANPCHIRGAGNVKRKIKIRPASLAELETITMAMPERYQLMVLLAAWCALRFGELTELRRRNIDLAQGVITVRRGVVHVPGEYVVGDPKSEAGEREVTIPPHLLPVVRKHLGDSIAGGRDGLLFPSVGDVDRHLAESTMTKWYYPARAKAGRSDLRFHDLRHTGAVLAAATGATLADLMERLGHSTPAAALRYQHSTKGGQVEIARLLSVMAEVTATDAS